MSGFPPHAEAPLVAGHGIVLAALETRDAPAMLANDRDPETAARFECDPSAPELTRCERYVDEAAAMWRTGERLVFAVRESPGGPLLGIVDARLRDHPPGAQDRPGPAVELSWTTVPTERGRGVATAAVRALIGFCSTLGIEWVWAKVDHDNAASLRVAASAGFIEAGRDDRRVYLAAAVPT